MDSLSGPRFATTRWSLVAEAGGEDPAAADALESLCGAYWRPLYAFLRRRGRPPEEAEDLVQGFLADLLARRDVGRAEAARGRFRTFLLASLKNYASKQRDHDRAAKRGGGRTRFSLDFGAAERGYAMEPAGGRTADEVFERQWALAALGEALAAVEAEQRAAGRGAWFEALRGTLSGSGVRPYAEIAAALDATPGSVKAAAARLRRDFRERLDRTLADGLAAGESVEAERRRLFEALA